MGESVEFFYRGGWWDCMEITKITNDTTASATTQLAHRFSLESTRFPGVKHPVCTLYT